MATRRGYPRSRSPHRAHLGCRLPRSMPLGYVRAIRGIGSHRRPRFIAADRLSSRSQRLVGHRRVPPHHPFRFPPTERHHDRRGESLVQRHGGAVVAEIVKVEILEPGSARGLPEDAADVHSAVGAAAWPREDVFAALGAQRRSRRPQFRAWRSPGPAPGPPAGHGGSSVPRRAGSPAGRPPSPSAASRRLAQDVQTLAVGSESPRGA